MSIAGPRVTTGKAAACGWASTPSGTAPRVPPMRRLRCWLDLNSPTTSPQLLGAYPGCQQLRLLLFCSHGVMGQHWRQQEYHCEATARGGDRACAAYQDRVLRNLPCKRIQVDEIWSFVYARCEHVRYTKAAPIDAGDVWTWTAICVDTKLIAAFMVGDRSFGSARTICANGLQNGCN